MNLDEGALNIFTDGSSYPSPRRGGLACRIVVTDENGEEVTYDEQLAGFKSGTNNQMELLACIEALRFVTGRHSPVNPLGYTKIVVYTDSTYVANNYGQALFSWARNGWRKRDGNPVDNSNLWKELVRVARKAGVRVEFKWHKGHSSKNPHNKAVDKLAKASAKGPLRGPVTPTRVRRKRTDKSTERGSIRPEGQRISIRIITDELLRAHRMYKYRYEVLTKSSPYHGNVDTIYSDSDVMLNAGHEYYVVLNDDPDQPRIRRVIRELKPREK